MFNTTGKKTPTIEKIKIDKSANKNNNTFNNMTTNMDQSLQDSKVFNKTSLNFSNL